MYWDCSGDTLAVGLTAEELEKEAEFARWRVKLDFNNLLKLAIADRPVKQAVVCGSPPPELKLLCNRLGVKLAVHPCDGLGKDQIMESLQILMLQDCVDCIVKQENPSTAVLICGGTVKGFLGGANFKRTLESMHSTGWAVEVLSWEASCSHQLRDWLTHNGYFISLNEYYESVTFLESLYGEPPRPVAPLDLSGRPGAARTTEAQWVEINP